MTPDRLDRIQHLYCAALVLEPSARCVFIDTECQGDPGLRREVRSLLDLAVQADALLERPARPWRSLDL